MTIRTSLSGQAAQTLNDLIDALGLDRKDTKVNAEALKIAMQIIKNELDNDSTTIKYLKAKQEGLSLTQAQRKYKVNYKTLQKLDETFSNYED